MGDNKLRVTYLCGHSDCSISSMDIRILSQLRIIDSDQVYPYEWALPSENESSINLSETACVRHPLLVTSLNDDSYLLLEEAEYFHELIEAGFKQIPAQVCPSSSIRLICSKIGITNFDYEDLVRLAARHPDQIILDDLSSQTEIPPGFIGILFEFNGKNTIRVRLRDSSKAGCPPPLDYLFRCILEKGHFLPVIEGSQADGLITKTAVFSATLTLPEFSLTDLMTAVTAERLFPPGIIRAVSNFRLLDIDFPVSALMSKFTIAQKEAFLRELVLLREQTCRTALYEGQVYLLNR